MWQRWQGSSVEGDKESVPWVGIPGCVCIHETWRALASLWQNKLCWDVLFNRTLCPLSGSWRFGARFSMSWCALAGVTDTVYFLKKAACTILGLRVSSCGVCKGCSLCLRLRCCQPLAYCASQCCGVRWRSTASAKPSSGLKKGVSLSEVSLVAAFIIESYTTLYNFLFFLT